MHVYLSFYTYFVYEMGEYEFYVIYGIKIIVEFVRDKSHDKI